MNQNKLQHTPGPWIVSHDLGESISIAKETSPGCNRLMPVAYATFTPNYRLKENREVAYANAALIAAAPDLLSACIAARGCIISGSSLDLALQKLEAVIAKANATPEVSK